MPRSGLGAFRIPQFREAVLFRLYRRLRILIVRRLCIGPCWLTIKSEIAERPAGATWAQRYGVDRQCGIGFTISLFVRSLAFEPGGLVALPHDRLGILLRAVALAVGGNWRLLFSAVFEPDGRARTLGKARIRRCVARALTAQGPVWPSAPRRWAVIMASENVVTFAARNSGLQCCHISQGVGSQRMASNAMWL